MISNSTSKRYGLQSLADTIRRARRAKGWSQRELGARAHIPQAQISRIENQEVDPQATTLLELARTLDLELLLAPRSAVTAVEAVVRGAEERSEGRASRDLFARLRKAANEARAADPAREDIASIGATLRDLEPYASELRGAVGVGELERVLNLLEHYLRYPPASRPSHAKPIEDAAARFRKHRNRLVHGVEAERPAYRLDDED
ncbi:MAG TPA: helix-turn-helix transcriptional regulator [Caulobacteraceae bacterium]|nr:helix-turn-helix transcriptional regulator [Caulobacteraceae bacterium]